MTTPPHDHSPTPAPIEAIDALAQLRGEIARLRAEEIALCDEIRTCAEGRDGTQLCGQGHFARIETRVPKRLDRSKLPAEILMDPQFLTTEPETYVFVWPAPENAETYVGMGDVAQEQVEPEDTAFDAPTPTGLADAALPEATTHTEPPVAESTAAPAAALPPAPDSIAQPNDDPFGISPFGPTRPEEAASIAPDMDVPDAAERAVENAGENAAITSLTRDDTPADLRPTEQAELQPMAGLQEEEIAQLHIDSETPVPLIADDDAVDAAEELEEMADLHAENPNIFAAPAPFSSRRAATGTDDAADR